MTWTWGCTDGTRAVFATLGPYVIQYTVDVEPGLVPLTIFAYVISLLAAVPVWLVAAQRLGKVKAWRVSVRLQIVAYAVTAAAMNPIFFGFPDRVRILFGFVLAAVVGATNSATITIAFSLQGDIIDIDALTTGETGQHGIYYAWWAFVSKCVGGIISMLTGFTLQAVGFVPNVKQTYVVRIAIGYMLTLLPLSGLIPTLHLLHGLDIDDESLQEARAMRGRQQLGGRAGEKADANVSRAASGLDKGPMRVQPADRDATPLL